MGPRSLRPFPDSRVDPKLCLFEFVYFARPDSRLYGKEVHGARRRMGELLADQAPVEADMVMGVPDSGVPAAEGFAKRSGIPDVTDIPIGYRLGPKADESSEVVRKVTQAIGNGTTGEISYQLEGAWHQARALSLDGQPIESDTEIAIERIEDGIAWVERWSTIERQLELP